MGQIVHLLQIKVMDTLDIFNPNVAMFQQYMLKVPRDPVLRQNRAPTSTTGGAIGVAVDGILIFNDMAIYRLKMTRVVRLTHCLGITRLIVGGWETSCKKACGWFRR